MDYLADGQTISLSCINQDSLIKSQFFDANFDSLNSYEQFYQCTSITSIYGHSIIQLETNYYVISDVICDDYKRCYEPLESELSYTFNNIKLRAPILDTFTFIPNYAFVFPDFPYYNYYYEYDYYHLDRTIFPYKYEEYGDSHIDCFSEYIKMTLISILLIFF